MGNAAGSDADCDDDEDAETKTDYEDFKKWLDKQEPSKPEGPPQAPAVPKAPVDPKSDVKWVCNICKMNAKQCYLSQLMSIVYRQKNHHHIIRFLPFFHSWDGKQKNMDIRQRCWANQCKPQTSTTPSCEPRRLPGCDCTAQAQDCWEEGPAAVPWMALVACQYYLPC